MGTKQTKIGTCALCQATPVKLCESHIIPEFLYSLPGDQAERNELWLWSSDPATRGKRTPRGVYERLLCLPCEGRFQRLEDYVATLLYDTQGRVKAQERDLGTRFEFTGIEYPRMKLFLLSMLWRMGVSRSDSFKTIQLDAHNEQLRTMLMNDDPGPGPAFGCVISYCPLLAQRHPKLDFRQFGVFPEMIQGREGYPKIRMVFGGLFWQYHITYSGVGAEAIQFMLSERGRLPVPILGEEALRFIYKAAYDVMDGKLDRE